MAQLGLAYKTSSRRDSDANAKVAISLQKTAQTVTKFSFDWFRSDEQKCRNSSGKGSRFCGKTAKAGPG
jgi:hypothetical protein